MELLFATQNENKIREIQDLLGNSFNLLSLRNLGITEEIPENKDTIKDNAIQKADYVFKLTGKNCFADDTGLIVDSLGGEPGVNSARYAGDDKITENNINKLLQNLSGIKNRKAKFNTTIALIINNNIYIFEGIVNGVITTERRGSKGFGYDPVFIPNGYNKTFAEMTLPEKNKISHRSIAFNKLKEYLNSNYK